MMPYIFKSWFRFRLGLVAGSALMRQPWALGVIWVRHGDSRQVRVMVPWADLVWVVREHKLFVRTSNNAVRVK